ncbi:MAG: C45 family peptidase [Reyranellaceae bacterium]
MIDNRRFFSAQGSARWRGEAQGRAFGPLIHDHVAALEAALRRSGLDDPRDHLRSLVAATHFDEAIRTHVPHLWDEMEGIAAGAGVECDVIYALQLMDEEWAYRKRLHAAAPGSKCSSFAIHEAPHGVTWIGQNMDLGAYTDGFQRLVLHVGDETRPSALVLTTAGNLALLGINDAGVGVCVNALPQLPSADHGVPVAFLIRRLLEARTAAEAADWCRALPHATNQHYLIADPNGVVSLECSAIGVTEYRPPQPDRVLHTNHPLAGEGERYPAIEANSVARLRSLEARLARGRCDRLQAEAALSAFDDPEHPVCRLRAGGLDFNSFTTGAMISRLVDAPQPILASVSFGPPSERGFQEVSLTRGEGTRDAMANARP